MNTKYHTEETAWVVLPDHFHMVLDPKDNDPSHIIHDLKLSFGERYRKSHNLSSGRLWQNRFWDHIIRDQVDLNRHIDYIHYNPVRHGFVNGPQAWKYSSFSEYKSKGYYADDWGVHDEIDVEGKYGE